MGKFIDLTGLFFGKWKVLQRINCYSKKTYWLCQCECGIHSNVASSHLIGGKSTKCKRCHNKNAASKVPLKHGHSRIKNKSKEYQSWGSMRTRCKNINSDHWGNYGKRGIKISDEWNDFSNFLSDMGNRPAGKTLDRINVNGNYCKENCKWSTPAEQSKNKRNVTLLEKDGIVKTKTEWASELKIPLTSFHRKIDKFGWPFKTNEKAPE